METKARKDKMKMDINDEELENKEIEIFGTHITIFKIEKRTEEKYYERNTI